MFTAQQCGFTSSGIFEDSFKLHHRGQSSSVVYVKICNIWNSSRFKSAQFNLSEISVVGIVASSRLGLTSWPNVSPAIWPEDNVCSKKNMYYVFICLFVAQQKVTECLRIILGFLELLRSFYIYFSAHVGSLWKKTYMLKYLSGFIYVLSHRYFMNMLEKNPPFSLLIPIFYPFHLH